MKPSNRLRVYLFGPIKIEKDDGQVHLSTRKERLLFAYLILNPEHHSREKVAGLFWPDVPDASARASLRNALSNLRRDLSPQLFQTDSETVHLNSNYPIWVDAWEFQTEADQFLANPLPDTSAVDLDLYAGDLLEGFYDDWVLAAREKLRRLFLNTLLEYTQQLRAQSEYARAIEFAEQVLSVDRANERAYQHLMFCHVALGNRDAALKQYKLCQDALMDELDVEPSPETKKLYAWMQQASAERTSVEASLTNLPIPVTSFVGRDREMTQLKRRIQSTRFVTLTGVGGTGKTRLAIRVATDLLDAFRDGVWWVDLAELDDARLVPRTVAKALGIPEIPNQEINDTLANFLNSKELLLVLDNCEHMVETSAQLVNHLLSNCPNVKVLATSRESLGIAGEQVSPVPMLSTPDVDAPIAADDLLNFESIRLFVDRANAASPDFVLTRDNSQAVMEVCSRLEGLPLALELAATRTRVLTVEKIVDRLDDAFDFLTRGSRTALSRHRTLGATIDWSYDLLSDKERTLFRRLSVFVGGWTLEAAEAVCEGDGIERNEVLDLLTKLVDKSLVETQLREGNTRFRMLQTLRHYGRERLDVSGESELVRVRHLSYFLQLVEGANPHLGFFLPDKELAVWMNRFEKDYSNLRAAIRWSIEKGASDPTSAEAGLRMMASLHWFWFAQGRFMEGRTWLDQLLEARSFVAAETQAHALLTAGYLACWQGDFSSGRPLFKQSLALFQGLENGRGVAFSLHGMGFVALGEGKLDPSRSLFEEALGIAREANDKWLVSFATHFLAIVLTYSGEYEAATPLFEEGNSILRELEGHTQGLAFGLFHLARIARIEGDYASAQSRHLEGLRLFQQIGDRRGVGYSLVGFVMLMAAQGHMRSAAHLAGAITGLQNVLGPFLEAPLQIEYDEQLAAVQAALDERDFERALAEGRSMTMEQSIKYVREEVTV